MKIRELHYSFHRWSLAVTASCAVVAFLNFSATALAAKPFLEKMDLFEEMTDGFVLYRIPGIVVASKGSILAYCEARKYTVADRPHRAWAYACLRMTRFNLEWLTYVN